MNASHIVAMLLALALLASGENVSCAAEEPLGDASAPMIADGGSDGADPASLLLQADSLASRRHIVDALRVTRRAYERAHASGDVATARTATARIVELLERVPHVTFVPPSGVSGLSVQFDYRAVPVDALTRKYTVDPGSHHVEATGIRNGKPVAFIADIEVSEGSTRSSFRCRKTTRNPSTSCLHASCTRRATRRWTSA